MIQTAQPRPSGADDAAPAPSSLRVTLAFPPQGHWTQPHLAIPSLKAWLEARGFEDVEQMDLSVEAFDHFLTAESLMRARDRVAERSKELDGATLPLGRMRAWRAATESAASADALIERVDGAKALLRGKDVPDGAPSGFWNTDRYVRAARTLYHGLRLVSAAHFPSELTPHNFTMGYSNDSSDQVLAATLDEEQNPFIAFYRDEILPRLVVRRPRVLGLSVLYGSQLVPALTLGRLVKEALPDCHVTMGGGYLAYIGAKVMAAPGLARCFDSMVFHEGERPLEALCRAVERGDEDLSEIGSLAWWDRRSGEALAVRNLPAHPIKLDAAPPPSFDGLPFEKYFSPELVIPYDVNRGCYYGECTFCTLPTVIGPGYRTRSAETIANDVVRLRDAYGTTHFNFITDCMPPGMIKDLPDELIARDAGITWWADARIEPKAYTEEGAARLYESGCRKLLFGFESAVKRILKMMSKGQSLKSVRQVAENCAAADISVTFYAMVGFPTETRDEARETLRYIEENRDVVREVSLQTFHIDEVAKTYRQPDEFGIRILPADGDLSLYHDYEASSGMTQEEAAEMFEEMMSSFRQNLPLFGGDNIFYFMQKSHYFLHLARGATPDSFAAACAARTEVRESGAGLDDARLPAGAELVPVDLDFSYVRAVETLGHPLARAARPDFLTGRFVEAADRLAEEQLPPLERLDGGRVLVYAAHTAEFVELGRDGLRMVEALRRAGTVGALLTRLAARSDASPAGLERARAFFARLLALGLLESESAAALTEDARRALIAAEA
ncbi:MAG: radical SAM protein [Planctomycetota bacterium]